MPDYILYPIIYLTGVLISSVAQIILKKNAITKTDKNVFSFMRKHCNKLYVRLKNSKNKFICWLKKRKDIIAEYLNPYVLTAYIILLTAMFITIYSYKYVPLTFAPILGATEYIFISILSRIFLSEKVNKKKLLGLIVILVGIVVFSIKI